MARRLWRWSAIALACWTVEGLTYTLQFHFLHESAGEPVTWGYALSISLTNALLWVPFTVAAFWLVERFPVERGRWHVAVGVHLVTACVVVLLRAIVVVWLDPWVGWYAETPTVERVLATRFQENLVLYLMLVGVAHALHYAQAVRMRDAQLARAQLQALTAQMRPHFLFNTLNTAASLMHENVVAAERVLAQLGELLRRSLAAGDTPEVSLRGELEFLRLYLEIEQARFEDHLSVQWHLDPSALDVAVPHLILQPLVENALRHGIAPRATSGTVTVTARLAGDWLQVDVHDDGVGIDAAPPHRRGAGMGLATTRARLSHLYGPRHRFTVRGAPAGGTIATLVIPARRAAARL
ncbi:MAG: sensor protein lytS [Luteitalea sp.]|nr:sensor protein lytS [Luteitalea sp.]